MTIHTLYRFYDGLDHLLYVGRTINPRQRWRDHEKTKPWFNAVAKVTREIYPDATALDAAERAAIATERPVYNVTFNSSPSPYCPTPPAFPERLVDHANSFAARLKAADVPLEEIAGCLGDETACECSGCHGKRLAAFEDLNSKYWWHPAIDAEIARVKRAYYAGWGLTDWYYDLFDIELIGTLTIATASREHPIPAYAEPSDAGLEVDCPFCFGSHVHFMPVGASLSRSLESGCVVEYRGFYTLLDDWMDVQCALEGWGEQYGRAAA